MATQKKKETKGTTKKTPLVKVARRRARAVEKKVATIAERLGPVGGTTKTKGIESVGPDGATYHAPAARMFDDYISRQTPRLQKVLPRWIRRGVTFEAATPDILRTMIQDCGRAATLVLLDVEDAALTEKCGKGAPRARIPRVRPTTVAGPIAASALSLAQLVEMHGKIGGMAIYDATSDRPASEPVEAGIALVGSTASRFSLAQLAANGEASKTTSRDALDDDLGRAVRLDSLEPGTRVKTPNYPNENLAGVEVTLHRLGMGSAVVRLSGEARAIRERGTGEVVAEFNAPGRLVTWGLSTMVVPLASSEAQS